MLNPANNIPEQTHGEHTDVIHFADTETIQQAHHLFLQAKTRLKDVSQWHIFAGPHSAKFALTGTDGIETYKIAEKGDLFYIDLPAPGPVAGDGKEWVRIEAVEEQGDEDQESEFITITVRPVANPRHPERSTAHFFSHTSTSTFIIERYKNHVSAAVYGRNETPNNSGVGVYDTVRNTIIALAAREGLSGPQWKSLVKGLLAT